MLRSFPRTRTHSCELLIIRLSTRCRMLPGPHPAVGPRAQCPDANPSVSVSAEGQVRGTSFGKRIGAFSWPSSALQCGRKIPNHHHHGKNLAPIKYQGWVQRNGGESQIAHVLPRRYRVWLVIHDLVAILTDAQVSVFSPLPEYCQYSSTPVTEYPSNRKAVT